MSIDSKKIMTVTDTLKDTEATITGLWDMCASDLSKVIDSYMAQSDIPSIWSAGSFSIEVISNGLTIIPSDGDPFTARASHLSDFMAIVDTLENLLRSELAIAVFGHELRNAAIDAGMRFDLAHRDYWIEASDRSMRLSATGNGGFNIVVAGTGGAVLWETAIYDSTQQIARDIAAMLLPTAITTFTKASLCQ